MHKNTFLCSMCIGDIWKSMF